MEILSNEKTFRVSQEMESKMSVMHIGINRATCCHKQQGDFRDSECSQSAVGFQKKIMQVHPLAIRVPAIGGVGLKSLYQRKILDLLSIYENVRIRDRTYNLQLHTLPIKNTSNKDVCKKHVEKQFVNGTHLSAYPTF